MVTLASLLGIALWFVITGFIRKRQAIKALSYLIEIRLEGSNLHEVVGLSIVGKHRQLGEDGVVYLIEDFLGVAVFT